MDTIHPAHLESAPAARSDDTPNRANVLAKVNGAQTVNIFERKQRKRPQNQMNAYAVGNMQAASER